MNLQTGKPDLFITMTGNPDWPEIQNNLLPNTKWQSNPFLVNDVFYAKQQVIKNEKKYLTNQLFSSFYLI